MKKIFSIIILLLTCAYSYAQVKYTNQLVNRAKQGDVIAQLNLGKCYLYGEGVQHDDSIASVWLKGSADLGNVEASYLLGCLYCDGIEKEWWRTDVNCQEGLRYLRQAAERGDKDAYQYIHALTSVGYKGFGRVYLYTGYFLDLPSIDTLKENEKKLLVAAGKGNVFALYYLWLYYHRNNQETKAFNYLLKAYNIIFDKDGKDKVFEDEYDYKDSIRLIDPLFINYDNEEKYVFVAYLAMSVYEMLGNCYENGIGTDKNLKSAIECYSRRTSSDLVLGAYPFGCDYGKNATVRKALCFEKLGDNEKCHQILDSLNYPLADLLAGERYFKGIGTKVNYKKAIIFFEKATTYNNGEYGAYETAPSDYADACYRLYQIYRDGLGVQKSERLSKAYFNDAVKYGSTSALYDEQKKYESRHFRKN